MKIYNEVTTRFNELTGKWETISEDSYDYDGPLALAAEGDTMDGENQGLALPANATQIFGEDTITDTIKTTGGYFTNGDGTLDGSEIHTGSLADSNENYYVNITQTHPLSSSAEVQLSVAYGHYAGSGSNAKGDGSDPNNLKTPAEAVYKQMASLLLTESEQSGGFKICAGGTDLAGGSVTAGAKDEYVYALIGKRARFKDRMNKKTWTLTLSGSNSAGAGGFQNPAIAADNVALELTDDSATVAATTTPAGPRYNIVSGTLGSVVVAAATKTYGWYYPEMGIMLFSGAQLSASIPGPYQGAAAGAQNWTEDVKFSNEPIVESALSLSSSGFAPLLNNNKEMKNHIKLAQCMKNVNGVALRLRSEEDQTQENYFCRVKAGDYNFSTNPTFTSGSENEIRNANMIGNPTTYITGVGLYNASGHLVATAKLSSPLKKNFVSEATIKVKLTY